VGQILGERTQRLARRTQVVERVSTNLHHQARHGVTPLNGRPRVSSRPFATFHAWIAWPAAPLIRLSSELMTMSQPVRSSTRAETKQRFEPTGSFKVGGSSVTTMKGSFAYVARSTRRASSLESGSTTRA